MRVRVTKGEAWAALRGPRGQVSGGGAVTGGQGQRQDTNHDL